MLVLAPPRPNCTPDSMGGMVGFFWREGKGGMILQMGTPMSAHSPTYPPLPKFRTAAEWIHDLGDVPLERIICDPWPGTATEADLLRMAEVDKQLCELVAGTLVAKPMGFVDSVIAARLSAALLNFADARRLGVVAGEAGMLRLSRGL